MEAADDETYRAAKAAAAEAQMRTTKSPTSSVFGKLFRRGSGGPVNGDGGYNSHGGVVAAAPTEPAEPVEPAVDAGIGSLTGWEHQEAAPGGASNAERGAASSEPAGGPTLAIRFDDDDMPQLYNTSQRGGNDVEEKRPQQPAILSRWKQWRLPEEERERHPAAPQEQTQEQEQERMQGMLARLAEAARTSTDAVDQLRKRRATTAEEMAVAAQAARLAGRNTELAEYQQSEAVNREDFEAAARCGDAAERHRTEEGEHTEACQRLRAAVAALDDEVDTASASVSARFAEAHAELSALADEVRSSGEGVREGFVGSSQRLRGDAARLEQERTLIEANARAWEKKSAEVQRRIGEDTKEPEEECSAASSELEEVNKRITELQEQLTAAESRASGLISTVSSCHQSIQAVLSKHSKQLVRVEKEEQAIKERRVSWVSKKDSAETARAAHDAAVAAHTEDMLRREEIIREIRAESAAARDFVDIVANAFVEANREDDSEDGDDGDDGNLEIEVSIHKAAAAKVQGDVTAVEVNLRNLQKELASIDVLLPVLEAEKKMATEKRDFKEAGRASKGIKEAAARKQQLGELAGEATKQHHRAHDELQRTAALLAEATTKAAEKSAEAEQKRLDLLRQKLDTLRSLSKQVSTANSEKFATEHWDEGEGAITVACVGAFVLESQIHLLQEGGVELEETRENGLDAETALEEDERGEQDVDALDNGDGNKEEVRDGMNEEDVN